MARPATLTTQRLLLRPWTPEDREPFALLNADARVMEHFPKCLDRAESDAVAARIDSRMRELGFGFWAIEVPGVSRFIGFVGLSVPRFTSHFTPCVEIGWRLAYDHWGHGYATEAARAAVEFAFRDPGLKELVAFTVPANQRSRNVMERLGMTRSDADDFDHPDLPEGHPIRRHVLYRLRRAAWGP
jgi:RimJ/RimL family protein N-acetyltransferase